MREVIENELQKRGYTIHRWHDTLKDGWAIEVEKDGRFTTVFVDEIANEMIWEEMILNKFQKTY